MTIAVIGAGAIGSLIAAYLHKAKQDVLLIGREDQVRVTQEKGLLIKSAGKEERVQVPVATKLDQEYDLVIFATKTQDLEAAYGANNLYMENCLVLSTQNGVQADNILSGHFDRDKILSSIVMFGSTYIKPGEIVFNFPGDWIIGRPFLPLNPQTHEIAALLGRALPTVVSDNIAGMKWLKLFVNFNNCLPALLGRSMQETFADLDFCRLSVMLLKEGVDIVKKAGIRPVSLPKFSSERITELVNMPLTRAAGIINKTLTGLSREPLYGSILQSIMRKRTSEIDFINGEVVHMATQMRTTSPLNAMVVELVHRVEREERFLSPEFVKKEFQLS